MMTSNQLKRMKRLTISDLAEQLGVSVATVSSVLNNRHKERRISSATVKRIQEAARVMGYTPNISARRLRAESATGHLVIAIITSFEAPLPLVSASLNALQCVTEEAPFNRFSFTTTIDMFHAGHLAELPGLLDGSRFNGAVIANTIAEDDSFLARHPLPMPVVFIGREIPGYSSVRELPERTGREAAEILHREGCQRLALLRAELLTQSTSGRCKGFRSKCQALLQYDPDDVIAHGFSEDAGYHAMQEHLATGARPDGLYCIMDPLAVGAYHAIKDAGLGIPGDVAVIGTGDYAIAPHLDPPLSTFTRSQANMHEEAVRLLLRHLTGELSQVTQIVVPVLPVLRGSTERRRCAELDGAADQALGKG
ncbi:MAG: LacI family DNA-binding transcriptional regulator [Sedimentisphaerales bacterium]|nr:LacI family DNA-binding transcriptional regulator [Sedimentisphaerales bacterium]